MNDTIDQATPTEGDTATVTHDDVWCLVRTSPADADEAIRLLDAGARVCIISSDVSALAELVAGHYDRFLPIETDVHDADAVDGAIALAREHFDRIDVLRTN